MDMPSFPKMLQFKRKMLPHPQLLRWSNWFTQQFFQVKHIKGKDNRITDYLSRKTPVQFNPHMHVHEHQRLVITWYYKGRLVYPMDLMDLVCHPSLLLGAKLEEKYK